jgi:beta-lactamase class A
MIRPWFPRHAPPPVSRYERAAPACVVLALVLAACVAAAPAVRERTQSAVANMVPSMRGTEDAARVPVATEPEATAEPTPSVVAFTAPSATWDDPRLEQIVEHALAPYQGSYAVVVTRLSDGRSAAYRADEVFYAASTFKLAVLYEAERRLSEGLLSLDDRLQLTDGDYAEDLGTAAELNTDAAGTISIGDALFAMITISDNTTAVALLHRFGGGAIDATLTGLGLRQTSVNTEELPTTANDMALLMQALLTGPELSTDAHAHARALLVQQETREGVPSVLPEGVASGNKTGTWPGSTHDVAFVDAPGGVYVIAVLTDGSWDWQPIADVSAAVYGAMTARGGD